MGRNQLFTNPYISLKLNVCVKVDVIRLKTTDGEQSSRRKKKEPSDSDSGGTLYPMRSECGNIEGGRAAEDAGVCFVWGMQEPNAKFTLLMFSNVLLLSATYLSIGSLVLFCLPAFLFLPFCKDLDCLHLGRSAR